MGQKAWFTIRQEELSPVSGFWIERIRPAVIEALRRGGLAILPTETSYMLAGNACNLRTMNHLRRLKNRPADQDLSVMFASVKDASRWTIWNEKALEIAERFLPGPLTLILPVRDDVAQYASTSKTLGVRIPGHPFLLDLLRMLDFPITATSANPHGSLEPYSVDACVSPVDAVWDAGTLLPTPPSTILDLSRETPVILRKGSIEIGGIT